VPPYFHQLQKNYQDFPRVELRNVAAGRLGKACIYYATDGAIATADRFLGQGVASFSRDHVRNFGFADDEILEVEVPVIPLSQVFAERSRGTDLLVIDVEGAEPEVLESMDWRWPVRSIMFESDNLGSPERQRVQAVLEAAGMVVFWSWPDSFAIAVDETNLLAGFMERERLLDERLQSDLRNVAGSRDLAFGAGSPAVHLLGLGWSASEEAFTWSCGEEAWLTIPTSVVDDFIRSATFHYSAPAPLRDLTIDFRIAGDLVTRQVIAKSDQLVSMATQVDLPLRRTGSVNITLYFDKPVCPAALGLGNDQRSLAIALSRIELRS
jgi:FkbM family methyltransferase